MSILFQSIAALRVRYERVFPKIVEKIDPTSCLKLAEILRDNGSGGHPLGDRILFPLIQLINGSNYAGVLEREKELELLILTESKPSVSVSERRNALDRVKKRMNRAKKILLQKGLKINHTMIDSQFRKLLKRAELQESNCK